jgi:hypothetical protein
MSAKIIKLARIPNPVQAVSEPIDKAYALLVYSMAGLPDRPTIQDKEELAANRRSDPPPSRQSAFAGVLSVDSTPPLARASDFDAWRPDGPGGLVLAGSAESRGKGPKRSCEKDWSGG